MAGYSATPPNHGCLDHVSLPRLPLFLSESVVQQPFSFAGRISALSGVFKSEKTAQVDSTIHGPNGDVADGHSAALYSPPGWPARENCSCA